CHSLSGYACHRAILVSASSRTGDRIGRPLKGQRLSTSILDLRSSGSTDRRRLCRFLVDRISFSEGRDHFADNYSSLLCRSDGRGCLDELNVWTSLRPSRLPNSHLCFLPWRTVCPAGFPGPVLAQLNWHCSLGNWDGRAELLTEGIADRGAGGSEAQNGLRSLLLRIRHRVVSRHRW